MAGEVKATAEAARQVKIAAQRLFAERGVDGVTVRDIADAAGQKNRAVVGYYFGSKEQLVKELVAEGAEKINRTRNRKLDELEAKGGFAVRDVVELLIHTSFMDDDAGEQTYLRFIAMLNMSHRALFLSVLAGRGDTGYQRCLKHLHRLLPHLPPEKRQQRFVFLGRYLTAVLSSRESVLADQSREHAMWNSPDTLDHFAQTVTAMLESPAD